MPAISADTVAYPASPPGLESGEDAAVLLTVAATQSS
jgi:hypothetical protein